jgi:hypothetical protein
MDSAFWQGAGTNGDIVEPTKYTDFIRHKYVIVMQRVSAWTDIIMKIPHVEGGT